MSANKRKDIRTVVNKWDRRAKSYDDWYETFIGAVEHYVDWELLRNHLPKKRPARILDTAGGTGRITLLLAKMGYSVTLCDISKKMLDVARNKLSRAGIMGKVKILQCDVNKLPFADGLFDFVLCWDGMTEAIKELVRVTKRRGLLSVFLVNRCREAIDIFAENPKLGLELMTGLKNYIDDGEEIYRVTSPREARHIFKAAGTKVLHIYAVCGWLNKLVVPCKVQESREWDKEYFNRVSKMLLGLTKEPSVQGLSRHLVVYAEKL